MDFSPPTNLDEMKKKWNQFETGEEFCEELQKYLVAICEMNTLAASKGLNILYNTAKNAQTGQEIIAQISYQKIVFRPS